MKTARKTHKADTSNIKCTRLRSKLKEDGKTTSQGYCAGQNSYVEKGEAAFVKHRDIPKLTAASRAPALHTGMVPEVTRADF